MSTVSAHSIEQAIELFTSSNSKKIKLAFDIGSDDFFSFVDKYCTETTKIKKEDDYFIIIKN
jgi:enolase